MSDLAFCRFCGHEHAAPKSPLMSPCPQVLKIRYEDGIVKWVEFKDRRRVYRVDLPTPAKVAAEHYPAVTV